MKLSPRQQALLVQSLHSVERAAVRWAGAHRMDDATLLRRIAEEFGISGGFGWTSERVDYWGGTNPCIEISIDGESPIELFGRDLLSAVRDALKISRPDELF